MLIELMMAAAPICEQPKVVDGDSIRCANLGDVRLLAIDAPDRTWSRPCKQGRPHYVCDDAAAERATVRLRLALASGTVEVHPVTRDRYDRLVARVTVDGRDMSCHQLSGGVARYVERYDNGRAIARLCSTQTR